MSIRDLLKRRRERESALPSEVLEELRADAGVAPGAAGPGATEAETQAEAEPADDREPVELPGADATELGAMLRAAASTGLPQVSTDSHTVDAGGGELGKEILGILAGHGIGRAGGMRELDPDELRALEAKVREALSG